MLIYPAIDIRQSKCVRLKQGDFKAQTVYYDHPLDAAKFWVDQGATNIHIVDLDGSLKGQLINRKSLEAIASKTALKIQFGGGIRCLDQVTELLDIGVDRIVIGSLAIKNPKEFEAIASKYKKRIVCAVDFNKGQIMTDGWLNPHDQTVFDFVKTIENSGCGALLVTNIQRDGMMTGPDLQTYEALLKSTKLEVIASGGVGALSDLTDLKKINIPTVIIGKAFYEHKFTFKQAMTLLGGELTC